MDNGVVEVPDVLILHRFNSVDSTKTNFIKEALLDDSSRERHAAIFEKLKMMILTSDDGGFDVDRKVSG
jgi:hypothetical protein